MKKLSVFLVLAIIALCAGSGFATEISGDAVAVAVGGAGGDSNVTNNNSNTIQKGAVDNKNTNTNIGVNTQGQQQGQFQGQNNNQVIAPSQEINIINPNKIVNGSAPNAIGGPELNFISPNEKDVQTLLPKFAVGTILPLNASDVIVGVVCVKADVKFKHLYKEVLKAMRSKEVLKSKGTLRYQIREATSTKTWSTSGSMSGNGVAVNGGAITGATGSLVPSIGRSKSSNLYTIIIAEVQSFK